MWILCSLTHSTLAMFEFCCPSDRTAAVVGADDEYPAVADLAATADEAGFSCGVFFPRSSSS